MASYQKAAVKPIEQNGNGSDVSEESEKKSSMLKVLFVIGGIAIVAYAVISHLTSSPAAPADNDLANVIAVDQSGKVRLYDEHDRFVMEDYDVKPTFSSFLPGVAGIYGKPVWSFYVNRGQGIASFGTESKDYPIMEFNAANKAYQVTPFAGFRTFIQGSRGKSSFATEPFSPATSRVPGEANESEKPKRLMYIGTNDMEIREFDFANGLETSVQYYVLPNADFSSQVRRTTFTNIGKTDLTLSALDGLAKMEPDGGPLDGMLKDMGRTLEGWFGVYHADDTLTMPYYRLSTEPGDSASVKIEEGGHYCLSFVESDDEGGATLLPIVYDTKKVFGQNTPLASADGLATTTVGEILASTQYGDARTSSAFAALDNVIIPPGGNITVASFYGKVEHIGEVSKIVKVITKAGYVRKKHVEAREIMDEMLAGVETNTANHLFNAAIKQNFMDNSLRGGIPIILGDVNDEMKGNNADEDPRVKVFHVFSRIHGDLERDYNAFDITPSYFSQGPGNYRDVAQNRRNDVYFAPRMGAFDVKLFLGYIQADSYEPLTVEAVAYSISDHSIAKKIAKLVAADSNSSKVLVDVLVGGPFRPGQMFDLCEQLNIKIKVENEAFINVLLSHAEQHAIGQYGTGYWADHWDYYLDLIHSYLAIYPDGEEALMYDTELEYFFSPATVKPRSEKYVLTLTFDGKSKHVLQLDATYWDEDKKEEQERFLNEKTGVIGMAANWQLSPSGEAFTSSPIAKLFLLGSMKYATRDAYGMGVEYEGGRPGWNDAMNGLVGMVGSGMPETYELYQLLNYVKGVVGKYDRPVVIPAELGVMLDKVNDALDELNNSGYTDPEDLPDDVPVELFNYWDTVASAREEYRASVRLMFSGETVSLDASDVVDMITLWIEQIDLGMARALKIGSQGYDDDGTSGVPPCYFSYDVTGWVENGGKSAVGLPLVNATSMKVGRFPLFLEGPVRMLKTIRGDKDAMQTIYQNVFKSGLRDNELQMYFLSANLKGQSYDMGRMMAFAPGWLENQSIWMHMSYKYYLELLRGKLYDEFFMEMKDYGGMLPFMDADVYGRSLMECSSFIASSAFPDPNDHGRGFLPRLSGSTAEFLSIWVLMFVGPEPFFIDEDGSLKMQLVPALPIWLFDENADGSAVVTSDEEVSLSFKLFADIMVTYHNSGRSNLYGVAPKSYSVTYKDGNVVKVDGSSIPTDTAKDIRRMVKVESIDAYF